MGERAGPGSLTAHTVGAGGRRASLDVTEGFTIPGDTAAQRGGASG